MLGTGEDSHFQATWGQGKREASTGENLEAKSPIEMIYFQQEYVLCNHGETEHRKWRSIHMAIPQAKSGALCCLPSCLFPRAPFPAPGLEDACMV